MTADYDRGVGEVAVVPWVPDRDPFEVLAEIAKIGAQFD